MSGRMSRRCGWVAPALVLAAGAGGCARLPESDGELLLPDRAAFPLVADALEMRCATLDCHGAPGRNLRLYSGTGLRLGATDVPGSGSTTEAEYDVSYRAIVGLEPAVLDVVLAEGGARPERLTLVRKGRGAEKHAAGGVLEQGDDADRCLVSWLSPSIDEEACARAVDFGPPVGWPGDVPP